MVSKSRKLGLFPFQHGLNGVEMGVIYLLSGVILQVLGYFHQHHHLDIGIITQVVLEPPIWEHYDVCQNGIIPAICRNNKKFKIDI